jgi:hypothetical protein
MLPEVVDWKKTYETLVALICKCSTGFLPVGLHKTSGIKCESQ